MNESFLLNHTTGYTRSAATQRSRLIGIVVPACMDHERAALDIGHLESRSSDGSGCCSVSPDGECRKIAEMSLALVAFMLACCGWIIVSACGKAGNLLAVLHSCRAVRVLVNMEPMEPRRQIGELRGEYQTLRSFGYRDCADALCRHPVRSPDSSLPPTSAANTGNAARSAHDNN